MSTVLDRALELARADRAMSAEDARALCHRDLREPVAGEAFAAFVAATIMGFEPPAIDHQVKPAAGGLVHEVTLRDSYRTRDA